MLSHFMTFALASAITFACLAGASYECTYLDASGASCAAFSIGDHETDLCYARRP